MRRALGFISAIAFLLVSAPSFADQKPLHAGQLVRGGVVGAFEHGSYPSIGDNTHAGVDVVADCGAPVNAWLDGRVIDVISSKTDPNFKTLGYMALLDHGVLSRTGKRTFSLYLHLQKQPSGEFGVPIKVGTQITQGSKIGEIGRTGVAYGCHLHFEVRHFASRFHPDWLNIYGKGDRRSAPEFLGDWTDPRTATFGPSVVKQSTAPYTDKLLSGEFRNVEVLRPSRVRNLPTTDGSIVYSTVSPVAFLGGEWVYGLDASTRWLRVELASMEIEAADQRYGYVWDGNLLELQSFQNRTSSVGLNPSKLDVRAYCARNRNDPGPGEQDLGDIPMAVRAANANYWRCSGGRVMVCSGGASGRACDRDTGDSAEQLARLKRYCLSSPGTSVPASMSGPFRSWKCVGTRLVSTAAEAVLEDGYLPRPWRVLN